MDGYIDDIYRIVIEDSEFIAYLLGYSDSYSSSYSQEESRGGTYVTEATIEVLTDFKVICTHIILVELKITKNTLDEYGI